MKQQETKTWPENEGGRNLDPISNRQKRTFLSQILSRRAEKKLAKLWHQIRRPVGGREEHVPAKQQNIRFKKGEQSRSAVDS